MPDIVERIEKPCGLCKEVKLLDAFYRCASAGDGRDTRCIKCRKIFKKKLYERDGERLRAETKRWHDANLEYARAQQRQYARDHRDEGRARSKKHYQDNKHHYIDKTRAYQARKLEVFDEYVDRLVVFARDGGVCGICGKEADMDNFHVDHVIPLIRGGRHNYGNVQTAHSSCNIAKRDRVEVKC